MAITKSAKKQIRKNKQQRAHNLLYLNKIKKILKDVKTFVVQKKQKEALEMLPKVYGILDKAAKVGIIKKNAASRKKSRITQAISKISK